MTVRHDERIDTRLQGHLTRAVGRVRAWIARQRAAHLLGRAMDAKPIAQINTRGKSPVIICAGTPRANLTKPFVVNPPVFRAAVQSNKVYPPRLSARALAGIAARRGAADKRYSLAIQPAPPGLRAEET